MPKHKKNENEFKVKITKSNQRYPDEFIKAKNEIEELGIKFLYLQETIIMTFIIILICIKIYIELKKRRI